MLDRHAVVRGGARALIGVAAIGLAALTVAAATILPLPLIASSSPAMTVTPQPAKEGRMCPGALLSVAEGTATSVSPLGNSNTIFGAFGVQEGVHATPVEPLDYGPGVDDGGTAPALITVDADPATAVPPSIAGSQSQNAHGEEISGLATAECGMASGDSWLAAGSTEVGRTTLVLLSNPSEVTASVDLTVYGESGAIAIPGAEGIIVEAGSQRVLPLAGLAPNTQSPVVHVQTRGGQVYASLQHSVIRGLTPGGVEMVGPTASPAGRQIIAGVMVSETSTAVPNDTDAVLSDAAPTVRVFSAGDTDAAVQISVVSEDVDGVGAALTTAVPTNTVMDVPLDGIAPGAYTVIVSSPTAVVASVRGATSGSSTLDFAWFVASKPVTGPFLLAVAKGPAAQLHLYSDAPTATQVTVRPVAGAARGRAARTITLEAGAAVALPVVSGSRYEVEGHTSLVAAVSYTGDGTASSFAVTPGDALATPLTVYRG